MLEMKRFRAWLDALGACEEALAFVDGHATVRAAYDALADVSFFYWLLRRTRLADDNSERRVVAAALRAAPAGVLPAGVAEALVAAVAAGDRDAAVFDDPGGSVWARAVARDAQRVLLEPAGFHRWMFAECLLDDAACAFGLDAMALLREHFPLGTLEAAVEEAVRAHEDGGEGIDNDGDGGGAV